MSEENEADKLSCCASCGVEECDDTTLKKCTACKSVRYCGVKCQKNHRPQHKRACKKPAAELRDELLFKQPESSHHGDCPICMIPLPLDPEKSTMMSCCSKLICNGCRYANVIRELQAKLVEKCPFCRKLLPTTDEEMEENVMKRIEANDPVAMRYQGLNYIEKGDYSSAVEYFTKAAELGDVKAHYHLSICYRLGQGVEKDEKKKVFHLEEAAIGGHPDARYNLGIHEWRNGSIERAQTIQKIGETHEEKSTLDLHSVCTRRVVSSDTLSPFNSLINAFHVVLGRLIRDDVLPVIRDTRVSIFYGPNGRKVLGVHHHCDIYPLHLCKINLSLLTLFTETDY